MAMQPSRDCTELIKESEGLHYKLADGTIAAYPSSILLARNKYNRDDVPVVILKGMVTPRAARPTLQFVDEYCE
ncbi:MAG: hypothetical protein HC865_00720, partial [Cyanobacteria bacterium RU_5_0]|nr:hypothetical protein [Cyanobacteria bacterium RU_5_0]